MRLAKFVDLTGVLAWAFVPVCEGHFGDAKGIVFTDESLGGSRLGSTRYAIFAAAVFADFGLGFDSSKTGFHALVCSRGRHALVCASGLTAFVRSCGLTALVRSCRFTAFVGTRGLAALVGPRALRRFLARSRFD